MTHGGWLQIKRRALTEDINALTESNGLHFTLGCTNGYNRSVFTKKLIKMDEIAVGQNGWTVGVTNGLHHSNFNSNFNMQHFTYQQEDIAWMKQRERDRVCKGGFVCHEMGLGKTFMMTSVIAARPMRTVVFAPKSTLLNWCDTLRHVGNFNFNVFEWRKGLVLDPVRPNVVVATHQSILKNSAWFEDQNFDRIVVDEAHVIRSIGTKLNYRIYQLAKRVQIRWGMTATPFNNTDSDIRAYMHFLFPNGSQETIRTDDFRWLMVRRLRSEVFPDGAKLLVTRHVYDFEHDEERDMYNFVSGEINNLGDWIHANRGWMPRHVVGAMIILMMLRSRQATIHPQIVLNAEKRWRQQWQQRAPPDWDNTKCTKVGHIHQLIKDDQKKGDSTLVITHFKDELMLIADQLKKTNITYRILSGETSIKNRRKLETEGSVGINRAGRYLDKWFDGMINAEKKVASDEGRDPFAWNSRYMGHDHVPGDIMRHILGFVSKPTVVLMQIQAGGVGISLPWINHVINTSPDWNPFLERQAIFRAYRLTTKHDVRVTQMYLRDTIDGDIHTKQARKLIRSLHWTGDAPESILPFIENEILDAE